MKKGMGLWCLIVILTVLGSGIVTIASAGLGIIPHYPEIREVNHDIMGTGYNSSQIHSTAVLYNPNIFPIKFKRVEYSIFLNDILIGSGHSDENVMVFPRSEKRLAFESEIYLKQIPKWLKERIKTKKETDVNIRGNITFDLGIFDYKHPINISVTEIWKKRFNNSFSFAYPVTDLTGDKISEMIIDVWHFEDNYISGEVRVVNGVDGSLLWNRTLGIGIPVAYPATDLNGDNITDFIVNLWDIDSNLATQILALDGVDGSTLWEWEDEDGLAAAYPCTDFNGDKITEIVINSYSFVTQETSLSSSTGTHILGNYSSNQAVAKTKVDSTSVTPDKPFFTQRDSTWHNQKMHRSEKIYALDVVPHAQFSLDKNFAVWTEDDAIMGGISECDAWHQLDIYNYDDASDTALGNLSFYAQADNITGVDWDEYAEWNESFVEWIFPLYPRFTIEEDDGFGTGFETISEEKYINVDVSRWMNITEFNSSGYQFAEFNVTFKDVEFLWCWGRIEANEHDEVRASIVPDTFETDAPLDWVDEWDHGIHFDFDREQIETNVTYHFSIIVRVEPEAPPVEYKPRFEVGQGLYESCKLGGEGYCVEIPLPVPPITPTPEGYHVEMPLEIPTEAIHNASACTNVSNQWTLRRHDNRIAVLEEVVELSGPHAEFHLNKDFNVGTEGNSVVSGTYERNIWYYMHIQNNNDDSDMVLGDLRFAADAENITGVDWSEYAEWNETSVEWNFPSDFVIYEDDGFGMGFGTDHSETRFLNVDLTRWMNQTEFNESGYQLVRFNVTFDDKNFEGVWGDINANEHYEVNASIVPDTFETDAPINWNEWEHGIHFDFDKEQLKTNAPYNFSFVVKVEPTGNVAPPILYKPQINIGEGLYYDEDIGTGYIAEMPEEMLPEHVYNASVSTNVSNAWLIKRHNQIFAGLEEVVEGPPEIPVTEIYVFNGSSGEELWNISIRNCLAAAYPISDVDRDNISELLINKWILEDDDVSFSKIEIVKGIDATELWNMSFADCFAVAYPVSDLNGDNVTELVVDTWRFDRPEPITEIFVIDGQDGFLLWNRSVNEGYLAAAYPITDFTGDNITEIAINAFNEIPSTIIEVVDGVDGSLLWSKTINNSLSAIYPATDLTKDGISELMINSWLFSDDILSGSEILIVNGLSGSTLWNWSTEDGIAVAYPATDLTNNNVSEIIIDVWGPELRSTKIFIFEGLTHTELFSKTMSNSLAAAYPVSDLTGDNVSEVAISELNFEEEATNITILSIKPSVGIFDTGEGTYPSIMGTHTGNFTPKCNITVHQIYTYPCVGTGGHSERVIFRDYETGDTMIDKSWGGYQGDYHNITVSPPVKLLENRVYNYTIITDSYPQIIHNQTCANDFGTMTCIRFVDANGKSYDNWIPAIRLE